MHCTYTDGAPFRPPSPEVLASDFGNFFHVWNFFPVWLTRWWNPAATADFRQHRLCTRNQGLTTEGTKTDSKRHKQVLFCASLVPFMCLLCAVPDVQSSAASVRGGVVVGSLEDENVSIDVVATIAGRKLQ